MPPASKQCTTSYATRCAPCLNWRWKCLVRKKKSETFLSPILTFDQELVILYRICNKHINLQTNDREIAVIYLHTYLCTNSINITTYINTSKERQLHQLNTICRYNIPHQNDTTATTLIKNRRNEGSVKATQRNLLE